MQLIIASNHKTRQIPLSVVAVFIIFCLAITSTVTFFMVDWLSTNSTLIHSYTKNVSHYSNGKTATEQQANNAFYAKKLGQLQAEVIRLKMLSKKLAKMAGINIDQYSLDTPPPEGGLGAGETPLTSEDMKQDMKKLSLDLEHQSGLMDILKQYEMTRENIVTGFPHGSPVAGAWVSSPFGPRVDPITGEKGFHPGIDLAAPINTPVTSVADGIVTRAGSNGGYGNFIEIDHGNGYLTHYAHLNKILVKKGSHVKKGQEIGLLGTTGHSTGPHLHFEVVRNGERINPAPFIQLGSSK